ncbi:MAG: type II toxin-antitoxin system RelE/ParE family toxin [Verrucomicrobia bacterium]|nr:type II toxin-antitoxin system RelE/ParE family toxin [Verrucomicrobiota bacterium]|tara:strand:- start:9279 stop:9572 length:294 start_codon:yes stop_codon:yes gene_type:complete
MNTEFHDEALVEYHASAVYSENVFGLGEKFVQAIERSLSEIPSDPLRYKKSGENLHGFRLSRFPYQIFNNHAPNSDRVTILAVAHTSRRPGYWKSRI